MFIFDQTTAAVVIVCIQLAVAIGVFLSLQSAARERAEYRRELTELLQKIDLLTTPTRERIIGRYDGMLADLVEQVPERVLRETGQKIFDTESRIIARLAELEPDLKRDPIGREKMNEIIESMESLESSISSIAAETVGGALRAARAELLEELVRSRMRDER